jgi:hypothetical protein
MDYGMIGKIEKAKRYAEEPERMTFNNLAVAFKGEHGDYEILLNAEGWHSNSPAFKAQGIDVHIMALEKVLDKMLKRELMPYAPGQNVVSDVEKARLYSGERDRITFKSFDVSFAGTNSTHNIGYNDGAWDCTCDFFHSRGVCCHTMALEKVLAGMLTPNEVTVASDAK